MVFPIIFRFHSCFENMMRVRVGDDDDENTPKERQGVAQNSSSNIFLMRLFLFFPPNNRITVINQVYRSLIKRSSQVLTTMTGHLNPWYCWPVTISQIPGYLLILALNSAFTNRALYKAAFISLVMLIKTARNCWKGDLRFMMEVWSSRRSSKSNW